LIAIIKSLIRLVLSASRDMRPFTTQQLYHDNVTLSLQVVTEWAKKVSCCIAGCNFFNYGPI